MIAMVLSNKQSWKLTTEDKVFILNNYKRYTQEELASSIGASQAMISLILNNNGIKNHRNNKNIKSHPNKIFVKGIVKDDIYKLMKKYNGMVTYGEMVNVINLYFGTDISLTTLKRYGKKIGFKSYKRNNKKVLEQRLFVDGDKTNYKFDNIIIINIDDYNFLRRDYESNKYTGESLKTMIFVSKLKRVTNDLSKNDKKGVAK